jgi:hypothetical protein
VIRFPKTELIADRARALQVPLPVIVRDLARIAERLHDRLDRQLLRNLTGGKLDIMRKLQPAIYQDLRSLADVIAALENPGPITSHQQRGVRFLRNPYTPEQVTRIVRERYVPLLKP